MNYESIAQSAAKWALSKLGCNYSQAKRTQENIFDCSSLVARAYTVQDKQWRYGGSVPRSNQEVYDDDFELLWPAAYADIGKTYGDLSAINLAKKPGDLQYLCTDSGTSRSNRITHIAMVADSSKIVHARGKAYGVCTNAINHYSGKICAVSRYNPSCTLRSGMKGFRTLRLQQALNAQGASLTEDSEYGGDTANAIKAYQEVNGLPVTGQADATTLKMLGLLPSTSTSDEKTNTGTTLRNTVAITGRTVNIRSGPGTDFGTVKIAHKGDTFEAIDSDGWQPIWLNGTIRWVSNKYTEFHAGQN